MNIAAALQPDDSRLPIPDGAEHDPDAIAERDDRDEQFVEMDSGAVSRLMPFIRPHRRLAFAAIAAILAFVAAQIAIPLLIKGAVDSLMDKPGSLGLPLILIAFGGVILLNSAANYASDFTAARLAQRIIFDLRRAMFAHLQRLSQGFMDRSHVGRIMSRLQGDVNALQEFFETSVTAVGDLALLIGIIGVLFALEWRLACLTLLLLPVLFGVRALWLPHARLVFARARDTSSIVNGALAENIGGVRVVQATRREETNLADFERKATENRDAQIASAWAAQIMVPTIDILTGFAMGIVALGSAWLVLDGRTDVGVMVAFLFYVQRFFEPIRTLSQQYTMAQRATTAAHRIFAVIDVPVEIVDKPGAPALDAHEPSIDLRDVTFGYRSGQPILRNFNLSIAPREVVALVGPTGSGKSSIAALICRLYDIWSGELLIGRQDVRDVAQQSISRKVVMVLQEPFLFTGTIEENIRFTTAGASLADIVRAAKAVRAHEFIERLPDGYDTLLDQRGQNLSIGQRQLLSFARALVADPAILILDEATASIDSFVEAQIQEALRVLMEGRTSILIAHRLATVKDADRIIVLKDGAILEEGSPAQLLAQGGLYASLHRHNFSSFDEL
ncbi:ABC transporter ATP-binding protein/permease [Sphingobium sufflavum]|uniref:ABC transporter ATP-binding protein n=1 Tax=Sphingobium sufflavum TaxID=1129547 RepID=UPI001F3BAE9B|nr:ABC transporter ATP-binding protein [Sphingobium sufflavum]MCE7796126.1 ABC transporter ATP-binding protein/permease [Sphingobium sufflavum]